MNMKFLPLLKQTGLCLINYGSDMSRYLRYAQIGKSKLTEKQTVARIMATSHVIEKGLSLPDTRLGYGKNMVESLMDLIKTCVTEEYTLNPSAIETAKSVLMAYLNFHVDAEHSLGGIEEEIRTLCEDSRNTKGGVYSYTKDQYLSEATGPLKSCMQSRYSLRQFGTDPVSEHAVLEALEMARKTPSVCNRQSWNVYWVRNPKIAKSVSFLQSGNRGFGHTVDSFLAVTTDLCSFFGVEERNQSFIDGGLYSMNLMLALHNMGIGTCPLNWSTCVKTDKKLRRLIKIPHSQNIIMLIAMGSIPDKFEVAKSRRKSLEDTLVTI